MSYSFPSYNCPSCGGGIELHAPDIRITTCPHCSSGLFLEDNSIKDLGIKSQMAAYPSLLSLFHNFRYQDKVMMPVGHVRFDYGRGFWDEWWVIDQKTGEGHWMSVDEGDYALERPISLDRFLLAGQGAAKVRQSLKINKNLHLKALDGHLETVRVTEVGEGVCIGLEGEIPELIHLNDRFDYAHLSGDQQRLYTVEVEGDEISLFQGDWIDPFLIKG